MCGIAGFLSFHEGDLEIDLYAMLDKLTHRGPDDAGSFWDDETGIALGHRRLSILDLSAQGHQPMISASGRYVITFNGEIYNYQSLRKQLPYQWKGQSDTEVVLAAIETWGLDTALSKFCGMFAFGLWDCQERELHLGRDRMGEKPLYYGFLHHRWIFASELKALLALGQESFSLNLTALGLFFRYGYIPSPHSIYEGIFKLEPGTYVTLSAFAQEPVQKRYFSFADTLKPSSYGPQEAVDELHSVLKTVIGEQMLSDVPIGSFLSGGIDSSLVTALMQSQSYSPIQTFSIGFEESDFNEAPYAQKVAAHLGTDHTELYVTEQECLDVIPDLSSIYDEPFADSSQIPTILVSRLARQKVTVALSGDGGDELFGGYERYAVFKKLSLFFKMPLGLRVKVAGLLEKPSLEDWERVKGWLPRGLQKPQFGSKMYRLASLLKHATSDTVYEELIRCSREDLVDLPSWPSFFNQEALPGHLTSTERMMTQDALTYLPDDILVKVDRAAMSTSLETRAPFLDPRVLDFAGGLPFGLKIRKGSSKWILRQILQSYVPTELFERPKQGFGAPLHKWLSGPLQEWAGDLAQDLRHYPFLKTGPIERSFQTLENPSQTWAVLMFLQWMRNTLNF